MLVKAFLVAALVAGVAEGADPSGAEAPKADVPAAELPAPKAKAQLRKIAVLDVKTMGGLDPKTFEGMSGLIAAELTQQAPALQVVGSSDVRTMIGFEKEKQLLGCNENSCFAEIGGALGVDYLLTTEGSKVGGTWILNMVLLDVVKARPVGRVSRRTERETRLVDEAIAGVKALVAELPEGVRPAPVEVAAAPAKGGRSKVLSWVLVGGGALAVIGGASTYGAASAVKAQYDSELKTGALTVTRKRAQEANVQAAVGIAVGAVGAAAVVWGALRLALPESPAAVAIVPAPGGVHASIAVRLP